MASNEKKIYQCKYCQLVFARLVNFSLHQTACEHKQHLKRKGDVKSYKQTGGSVKKVKRNIEDAEIETSFDKAAVIYKIKADNIIQSNIDVVNYIQDLINAFKFKIENEVQSKTAIKIYFSCFIDFHLAVDAEYKTNPTPCLSTTPTIVFVASNIDEILEEEFQKMCTLIENFEYQGSGWILDKILGVHLHVLEYKPLYGSSYFPLPPKLRNKKAVINVQNEDNKCFIWGILAGIKLNENLLHPERIYHYKKIECELNLEGLPFPVALKDIPKFEKKNDISVSVYGWEKERATKDSFDYFLYPLQVTKTVKFTHVNLLLLEQNGIQHYCTIKDFGKLARTEKQSSRKIYCRHCLHGFCYKTTKDGKTYTKSETEAKLDLEIHENYCSQLSTERIKFPDEQFLCFKNIKNQLKSRYLVYADFEAFLTPYEDEHKTESSQKYQRHHLLSYAYKVVSDLPEEKFELKQYVGPNVIDHFFTNLKNDWFNVLLPNLQNIVPIQFNENDKILFKNATVCIICEKKLKQGEEIVVRDHDHATGKYRGAAHQHCNLEYSVNKKLTVVFHNLQNYDAHFIFQDVKPIYGKINVIANTTEKYITFSIGPFRFIDSFKFLTCSLEKLATNVSDFHYMTEHFPNNEQRKLLTKKQVFPYDWLTNPDKLNETSLPSKDAFFNKLNNEGINDADYEHAQTVFKKLGCKSFKDYHDLYLTTDVLLLTDIFEHFRKMCLQFYKLDPVYYCSLPGFSWDAMLKFTNAQIEICKEPTILSMIQANIRGGVSMISHRLAEANNPQMKNYDEKKPTLTLKYFDANSLYAHTMKQKLPIGDYKLLNQQEIANLAANITNFDSSGEIGYILECDLHYPKNLHINHSQYPLCPEKIAITEEMLSTFQRKNFTNLSGKNVKLVPNLNSKFGYVLHIKNLQQALDMGLELIQITQAVQFKQSAWLASYVKFNIEKRRIAVLNGDEAGKSFFKLILNAIFGKCLENVRLHKNVEIVTDRRSLLRKAAKPNFKSITLFRKDLAALHMAKTTLLLNKPTLVGFTILDLSKVRDENKYI